MQIQLHFRLNIAYTRDKAIINLKTTVLDPFRNNNLHNKCFDSLRKQICLFSHIGNTICMENSVHNCVRQLDQGFFLTSLHCFEQASHTSRKRPYSVRVMHQEWHEEKASLLIQVFTLMYVRFSTNRRYGAVNTDRETTSAMFWWSSCSLWESPLYFRRNQDKTYSPREGLYKLFYYQTGKVHLLTFQSDNM